MKKSVWAFGAVLVIVAAALVYQLGWQPQAKPLIAANYVESAWSAGEVVWQKLREEIRAEKHIVFGVQGSSRDHVDLVRGLMASAEKEDKNFQIKIREKRVRDEDLPEIRSWPAVDSKRNPKELVSLLRESESSVLLVPSVYSSHIVGETPVSKVEKQMKIKFLTLSIVRFVTAPEDINKTTPPCDAMGSFGEAGMSALGCMIRRKSSSIFRNKLDRQRYVLAMGQTSAKDYIIYLNSPVK